MSKMKFSTLTAYQTRLLEIMGIIRKGTADTNYKGIEDPVVDHANLVYFATMEINEPLTHEVVEGLVIQADKKMGEQGLSAGQVDLFVTAALLLIDHELFMDHILATWRLKKEAEDLIKNFADGRIDFKEFWKKIPEYRI